MSTDPLSQLYTGKCHSQVSQINVLYVRHVLLLLRTVVLIKVVVFNQLAAPVPEIMDGSLYTASVLYKRPHILSAFYLHALFCSGNLQKHSLF
jgi:hypothetical protein